MVLFCVMLGCLMLCCEIVVWCCCWCNVMWLCGVKCAVLLCVVELLCYSGFVVLWWGCVVWFGLVFMM